ncbi:MAG: flagellar hook-length control protein FliK [Marinobacter sp.]|nr:flagellar hook-length control protein FliK [Marinobacter sp.]
MQQNILSQSPAPGPKQDVSGSRQANNSRDPDNGKSRFDEVSRAEQKRLEQRRLEQKQADRREQAERAQDKRAQDQREQDRAQGAENRRPDEAQNESKASDKSDEKPKSEAAGSDKTKSEEKTANSADKEKGQEMPSGEAGKVAKTDTADTEMPLEDMESAMAPLTFAMLQTLSGSGDGKIAAAGSPVAVNPGMTGKTALQGLLTGQPGQPGQNTGSAGKLLATPGAQLTDMLSANVSTETSRPIDPTSLLSTPRFQTTLEQVTQQAAQPGKLAAENAVPLRSYATSIDVPVGQAEWGDKVMGKLSFLTARNMQVAEIHLTPPDMGPMEVKVRMQNEQANITVHAANPVVREQLEQNSHRLRDMLGEQGVELGQFDVSDQAGQQAGSQDDEAGEGGGAGQGNGTLANGESDESLAETGHLDLAWNGEVDTFA